MDTRSKIIDWPAARRRLLESANAGSRWMAVTGHFDPLLASHARRFSELAAGRSKILAIIVDSEVPLLSARDRASMVAALAAVDAVTLAPETDLEEVLSKLPAELVVREEAADVIRAREFASAVRLAAKLEVT